jgi:D-alanine-D-alanine ligase
MKKNIALIAGGDSGEYVISVSSAGVIKQNIDHALYNVFTIIITGKKWIYVDDAGNECLVSKDDFSIRCNDEKITFDCAFITIHGTPGEDGKLQGYLDMMRIPYTTSGQLACSITFNKYFCNTLAGLWGAKVARSAKFSRNHEIAAEDVLAKVNLPVFVKPNKGGSSLGTFFVKTTDDLISCINNCLKYDDEALVEEFIDGTELTCGVYRRRGEVFVLPVTEIVSKSDAQFFDYQAKYTMGAADEITPARIPDEVTKKVQETTAMLYERFELKGVCRLDYIYNKKEELFFLEANITPGMTERSIVPQQAAYCGINLTTLFTELIEEALDGHIASELS